MVAFETAARIMACLVIAMANPAVVRPTAGHVVTDQDQIGVVHASQYLGRGTRQEIAPAEKVAVLQHP